MRTITNTFNIYKFNELSEEAQGNAHENYITSNSFDYFWNYEYKETLEVFCDLFGVKLRDWEISTYGGYYFKIDDIGSRNIIECSGLRLSKYLNNNNLYYDKWSKNYVNIDYFCDNLGLTGVCSDYDILKPIKEATNYKTIYASYEELIAACLDSFFSAWLNDMEYQETIDFFKEECDSNDWEFYEDGTRYN